MSYANFIPNVWAAGINRELSRTCVFADGCHSEFVGQIGKAGESITFVGCGKPTIRTIDRQNANSPIESAEEVEDTSVIMPINRVSYFNYKVGDIDKAQAIEGLMEALQEETTEGLSNEVDKYIANLAKSEEAVLLSASAFEISEENVMQVIDDALEKLYKNDVKDSTYIEAILPPYMYMALKRKYVHLDTDNSEMLKNGKVGMYGKVVIKMSNNVANDGENDYVMVRTKRAIGYAKPLTHTEPYRPENGFSDAVKGFILYDAKILRPKEMVVIKCKKASA